MKIEDLFPLFPVKRIKPVDGMAITADIWEEAHKYHQKNQQFRTLLLQDWGIVSGLDVIASDPPDSALFITPGIAVDPNGRAVVLSQPIAYDIGEEVDGLIYLLLSYDESPPRHNHPDDPEEAPLYIRSEFSILARNTLPNTPYVELCRVNRKNTNDTFHDAKNGLLPSNNEIDLRFRREINHRQDASIAVAYLGDVAEKKHGLGVRYLAKALNQSSSFCITLEDGVEIAPGIEANTLIYLVGSGEFTLNKRQVAGLTNYVNKGRGTLLLESVDAPGYQSFLNFLENAKMKTEILEKGHSLLMEPNLFAAPPPGYSLSDESDVLAFDGGILSAKNYGLLWQGEVENDIPSREYIRTGIEWGHNIISLAVRRKRFPAA